MSATATIKHIDPTQVELEIAIPREDVDHARERAYRDLVKNARIPGFRPGKAPRKIFEAQYGTAGIEERAMDKVVPEAYTKALTDNDLEPVDRPQMELLPREDEEGPLRFRATVAVRPQFTPQNYKGLELEAPAVAVTDNDVERALEQLRKDAGTLVPVDRPVAIGDTPTIDYKGTIDGVAFEGGTAEGQPTEILAERFIPGFADGIAGMKAGETKDVEAKFPDDYSNTELAGKTAIFTVTVHENKAGEPAELDDALAARFRGEGATIESLRTDLRTRLESGARDAQRRTLTSALLHKVTASHEIALPEVMVERETDALENEARGYIERAGLTWEKYLEGEGKTVEAMHAEYREQAQDRVKTSLILEAIAKAENIRATAQNIEAEVMQLSRQYGQPREAILEMLRANYGALVDGIVRTKTVEFLLANAKVTEIASPAAAAKE